jgi:hypothetical protein
VAAYQPCRGSGHGRLGREGQLVHCGTVATQHCWYFRKKGIFTNPRKAFATQLSTQLRAWRSSGEGIILFIDIDENVYTGNLAEGLHMEEQILKSTGQEAPHSHQTGQVAIVGIFATPEIVCTNSYLSPHGAGNGDHRFQVHNFDAYSILGTEYQKTTHPSGQVLRCKVARTVKKYNTVLKQLLIRHRSFEKLEYLQQNHDRLGAAKFQLMFNNWDREVTCFMLGSEKQCNKYRKGSIKFSPVIGLWIRRIQLY